MTLGSGIGIEGEGGIAKIHAAPPAKVRTLRGSNSRGRWNSNPTPAVSLQRVRYSIFISIADFLLRLTLSTLEVGRGKRAKKEKREERRKEIGLPK